ncbi:MAG: acyl-CoA dehydrogenase family protein [bacterium]|nr:acyl-CoA/acyl-ACP dehydrogenase [Candidatus Sumerlaeota bacterium]
MTTEKENTQTETLRTLPGDDVRQILWRFSDRYDLQMLVQSARAVARGPVARLVAAGGRESHDWTPEKDELLKHFDEAGITSAFMEPAQGGYIEGAKNTAVALIAFELSWVDAGAATAGLANNLALEPIQERGTPEQFNHYMSAAVPPQPGEDRKIMRGSFCLTEPLPYVGVDTGVLAGRLRVAEWKDGEEPILQADKRGRFITNMGYADFVTLAVDSADERIKGSCMVIVESTDPGLFDRGTPTRKLVHQLSSTSDPSFSLRIPASRIIGGYTVKDGKIVPNYSHSEVIEAVFARTRVTVAVMTAAKLLSAVEPIIRYQRGRFRGGETAQPGAIRYDLGLQAKEDVTHRLADVWATGEAAAALAFAAARVFDTMAPLEARKNQIMRERGALGGRAEMKALKKIEAGALEFLNPDTKKNNPERHESLKNDELVQFMLLNSQANVLCPASKLWNTGHGANMMREAVSLMGGYGITEDCPGFLGQKWMDSQLEATYEGPEAVQRRQLSVTMTQPLFLAQFRQWIAEMREIASRRPGTGACTLATAMRLWLWSLEHLQTGKDANGAPLYQGARQGVTFPLADALAWLLAARQQILDLQELEAKGPENPVVAEGLEGTLQFLGDLCHVQAARAAGEAGRICAELVHGYNRHPARDDASCAACVDTSEFDELESLIPGTAAGCDSAGRPLKAGPCVKLDALAPFARLRLKLDGCLTGARLAKDRAANALTKVMIPEALDYPV